MLLIGGKMWYFTNEVEVIAKTCFTDETAVRAVACWKIMCWTMYLSFSFQPSPGISYPIAIGRVWCLWCSLQSICYSTVNVFLQKRLLGTFKNGRLLKLKRK